METGEEMEADKNLSELLEDSFDGVVIHGNEESFVFEPPAEKMGQSSNNFEGSFASTVVQNLDASDMDLESKLT